jgi:hypothetical protein
LFLPTGKSYEIVYVEGPVCHVLGYDLPMEVYEDLGFRTREAGVELEREDVAAEAALAQGDLTAFILRLFEERVKLFVEEPTGQFVFPVMQVIKLLYGYKVGYFSD